MPNFCGKRKSDKDRNNSDKNNWNINGDGNGDNNDDNSDDNGHDNGDDNVDDYGVNNNDDDSTKGINNDIYCDPIDEKEVHRWLLWRSLSTLLGPLKSLIPQVTLTQTLTPILALTLKVSYVG
jgi:hypothetical protein